MFKTIMILIDRSFLVDTKKIIFSLVPLCSEVDGTTPMTINDSDLSNTIVDLNIQISTFAFSCFSLVLFFHSL